MTKEQILKEVKLLDPLEQEELADAIWLMAHGSSQEQVEAAWAEEIRQRIARADRGEGSSTPVEEVLARLSAKRR